MRATSILLFGSPAKLRASLGLGALCGLVFLVNPAARDAQQTQQAWESLWSSAPVAASSTAVATDYPTKAIAQNTSNEPLPSISAGAKYYAVSVNAKGKEDMEFDKKVTSFIETSQARAELLVATLESNPARAKTCANTLEGSVCRKLNDVMTDAVTSLDQAELAIASYQKRGVVADPVLARLQAQVKALRKVSERYPGIGPRMEP